MLDSSPDTSLALTSTGKATRVFSRAASADPLPWALWLLASRTVHKFKSYFLSLLFRAPGLYLGPRCLVRGSKFMKFGKDIYATSNLWLEVVTTYRDQRFSPSMVVGNRVSFSDGAHITCIDRIVVGNDVLMGSHVYISDHNHGVYKGESQSQPSEPPTHRTLGGGGPVVIGDNVWIGDNVVILGPATIGNGAVLAANSVVRGNVTAETIVSGIPARILKQFQSASGTWEKA
jgi:acetyltransferase-like isoleucine patch superfamily enzyme